MAATGRAGASERLLERFQFGLHAASGIGRQLVAESFGRGMRAMRGGESIVDPDVAELRQRVDKCRIVLFFFLVEARVFQTENVARLHRRDGGLGCFADAIVGKSNRSLEHARDFGGDRLERFLRVATLRPAEVR